MHRQEAVETDNFREGTKTETECSSTTPENKKRASLAPRQNPRGQSRGGFIEHCVLRLILPPDVKLVYSANDITLLVYGELIKKVEPTTVHSISVCVV